MQDDQRLARIFGLLFIITFVTSIPALFLYETVLRHPSAYIAGGGHDSRIYLGVLLELFLIISNIGTAVVPSPIFRRQNEPLAIGYITARVMECTFIAAGIIFMLGVVSLRHDSPHASDLAVSLAALKDWTFQLGPNWIVGWGNGLILGYLMYRSGLVPRRMAWFGLIGGPLIVLSGTGVIFGWWDSGSTVQGALTIPEFIWEAFLGIYCAIWGFRRDSPILSPGARGDAVA
jgi:uncharacterized protein DUF4386